MIKHLEGTYKAMALKASEEEQELISLHVPFLLI